MAQVEQNQWVPCPAGELQQLEKRLAQRRFGLALKTLAAGVVAASAVGLLAWQVTQALTPSLPGSYAPCPGTPCTEPCPPEGPSCQPESTKP
jgi:hypothetical protein